MIQESSTHVVFLLAVQVDYSPGGLRVEDSSKVFWVKFVLNKLDKGRAEETEQDSSFLLPAGFYFIITLEHCLTRSNENLQSHL